MIGLVQGVAAEAQLNGRCVAGCKHPCETRFTDCVARMGPKNTI